MEREFSGNGLGVGTEAFGVFRVLLMDALEDLLEARATSLVNRREIGAPEKRGAVGRDPHVQRPSAVDPHGLDRAHIDRIHIGPRFPVDLDGDEIRVQVFRGFGIIEGFLLHDMAPMAGGVPDAHQDRDAPAPSCGEGLISPWIPVDRVVGVLLQVGAGFEKKAIGVDGSAIGSEISRPGLVIGTPRFQRLGQFFLQGGLEGFGAGRRSKRGRGLFALGGEPK